MKKHKIKITGYTTIEELELDLTPGVQGFVGKNATGKTNILKAIQDLVSGGNDAAKIRDGANKYVLQLQVIEDDKIIAVISRTQTDKSSTLTSKGLPVGFTPKAYLAKLFDSQMLNPLRLVQEDPVKYLKKHLPVKLTPEDIPESCKSMFEADSKMSGFTRCELAAADMAERRVGTGRLLKQAKAVVDDLKTGVPAELPDAPHDREKVSENISGLNEKLTKVAVERERFNVAKQSLANLAKELCELEKDKRIVQSQITKLAEDLKHLEYQQKTIDGSIKATQEKGYRADVAIGKINIPTDEVIKADIKSQEQDIVACDQHDELVKRFKLVYKRESELEELEEQYTKEDKLCKYFTYELPKTLIERCKLPVKGIEFRENTLFVDGRRIDLMSETQKAIVATKLAVALAKSKGQLAISLDGVEIMDPKHMQEWLDVAKTSGLKVFYTRQGVAKGEHEFEVIDGKVSA